MDEIVLKRIINYYIGNLGVSEREELREWIDRTPENRAMFEKYLRLVKIYRMTEGESMLREEEAWIKLSGKMKQRKIKRLMKRAVAIAATVLLFIGVGLSIWLQRQDTPEPLPLASILPGTTKATLILANGAQVDLTRDDLEEVKERGVSIQNDTLGGLQYDLNTLKVKEPVWHTVKVPVAGEYHFTLPDGTKVWLNSDSELTFPMDFIGDTRKVSVKGEVYFEVKPDKEHPFIVSAKEVEIEVLGTKFNVSAYGEDAQVVTTLTHGAVNVGLGEASAKLQPGEQAVVNLEHGKIIKKQVETDMYVSWINGVFEYENMTLEDIVVQLSRWYDVDFIFSAPEFKERRFTGVVRKYDLLNDVLKIIEKTTNVSFLINGREIAVKSAGR